MGFGPEQQLAPARFIGGPQLRCVEQDAAGGKVRGGEDLHQLVHGDIRVVDLGDDRVDALPQVVGRDVGGQTHGNAARAVHQQIGEAGGQHIRLLQGIIEIQPEGHGVLVDVLEHEHGQRGHAGLGVTHGGGAVAVHGAEVAVAVHQRAPHAEILRQAHQRVVYAAVAMGVIFT